MPRGLAALLLALLVDAAATALPAEHALAQGTWYYCDEPAGYYPYVTSCRRAWRPVASVPQAPAPEPNIATPKPAPPSRDAGPSFDCSAARGPDEILICSDAGLSRADRAMAERYRTYRDVVDPGRKEEIVKDQRRWIAARAAECGIERSTVLTPGDRARAIDCFALHYQQRIGELDRRLGEFDAAAKTAAGTAPVELVPFGSRAGMEMTIISKEGLGTNHAVIRAKLTEVNAERYCGEYAQDPSRSCIERYLNETKVADSISADCEAGTFKTFYGDDLQLLGKNFAEGEMAPYVVRDRRTGQLLDGSMASGLSYDMDQFNALCPGKAAVAAGVSPPPQQSSAGAAPRAEKHLTDKERGEADVDHDYQILVASGERLVAVGALKYDISGWHSSLDVTLRDLSTELASVLIQGACDHVTELRGSWSFRVYLVNGTLAGECRFKRQIDETFARGAVQLDKTMREEPWKAGLLRAMGINTNTGPMPPLSSAETRCRDMLQRSERDCKGGPQTPECAPEATERHLDQCVADLKQEWMQSH